MLHSPNDPRIAPERALTRRDFLALSAALTAALTLPGCGGGGGGGGSSSAANRTQPQGDLKNQVNQFSLMAEQMGRAWTNPSQAMAQVEQIVKTRGRADAPPELFFSSTYHGLKALRGVQEVFARQLLTLDDMGAFGQKVSSNLSSTSADALTLQDPLWIGAMMHTQHCGMVMVSTAIETFQIAGLGQFLVQADATTDANEYLVTYAIIADLFNSFVDKQAALVQMAVDPTWKLNDSETVTAAIARQELARIESILDRLPFGPGYVSGRTTRAGDPNPAPIPDDEIPSLIGEFIGKIVEAVKDGKSKDQVIKIITDTAGNYSKRIDINPTGLMKSLGKTLGTDILKEIAKRIVVKWVKDRGGAEAECAAKLMLDVYDLVRAVMSVVGTLEVPPLAVVMAGIASLKVIQLMQDIDDCTKKHHTPKLTGRVEKIEKRRGPVKPTIGRIGPITTQTIPHNQRVPDHSEKRRRRCVRVRRKEEVRGKIINYPRSQPSGPKIEPMMATAGHYHPEQFRGNLNVQTEVTGLILPPGRSPFGRAEGVLARTHENLETSSAMLLWELADRNKEEMNPSVGDGTLDFTASDYAALFTLEPGTETFKVPSISQAVVAVTAQDFVPHKEEDVDLTRDGQLAALTDMASVSLGVLINAK